MKPDSPVVASEIHVLRAEVAHLRAENARLREQSAEFCLADLRLRRLLESQIIGVLIGSAGGEVLEINRAFEQMIGRPSADLKQLDWQTCVPPEELPRHREKGELLWKTGSCAAWETMFIRPDGARVPIITGATLVDGAQCDIQGDSSCQVHSDGEERTLLMWALDISDSKNIENELRASERRMRSIVENLHDGLLITDLSDVITYANGRISEMTGYSNGELMGAKAHELLSDPMQWEACLRRNLQRKQNQSETYEVPVRHKDGSTRWMLINGSPLRDAEGFVVGTIGAHFDITDRKRDESERAHVAAQLENSNRDLETFAFAVSHDLKEPLRKIEVFGARLQSENADDLTPEGRDYLARMRAASRRMTGLIDGLLLYSRAASARENRQIVELEQIAQGVLLDLELAIERAGARVEVGALPRVFADPIQMRQLLQNLVSNAIAYRRPQVASRVRISAQQSDGICHLEIADNGRGFAPEEAERIFEIFYRSPAADSEDLASQQTSAASRPENGARNGAKSGVGSGVGLTICRKIVERHGGAIRARGSLGEGATFSVELPALEESNAIKNGETMRPATSGREET